MKSEQDLIEELQLLDELLLEHYKSMTESELRLAWQSRLNMLYILERIGDKEEEK